MGMSYSEAAAALCQEAMYLIRQDTVVPSSSAAWSSDTPIEWKKCKVALESAADEVLEYFGWTGNPTKGDVSAWAARVRSAVVYRLARELSISVCGRLEDMKTFDALYRDALAKAVAEDLQAALDAEGDTDTKEVMALIGTNFSESDRNPPRSYAALKGRIGIMKDTARKDVLAEHDWNFAKSVEECGPSAANEADAPYAYSVPYPGGCIRVVAAYGPEGDLAEWKVEDGLIKSRRPIRRVKHTRDVRDTAKWPAGVRAAYIRKLASMVARTIMNSSQDAQAQEALYRDALATAKLRDTGESNAPTDAWGPNHHVDAMKGDRWHARRPAPWER